MFGDYAFQNCVGWEFGGRHIIVLYNVVSDFLTGSLEVAPPDALGPEPNTTFQKLPSYYGIGLPPVRQ